MIYYFSFVSVFFKAEIIKNITTDEKCKPWKCSFSGAYKKVIKLMERRIPKVIR